MWTTQQAIALIREIHPGAFAAGWNLHLGGGLLTKVDSSDKDADILAMPRYQEQRHDIDAVRQQLAKLGWQADLEIHQLPYRQVHTFRNSGRVLEIIFVQLNA